MVCNQKQISLSSAIAGRPRGGYNTCSGAAAGGERQRCSVRAAAAAAGSRRPAEGAAAGMLRVLAAAAVAGLHWLGCGRRGRPQMALRSPRPRHDRQPEAVVGAGAAGLLLEKRPAARLGQVSPTLSLFHCKNRVSFPACDRGPHITPTSTFLSIKAMICTSSSVHPWW